MAHDKFESCQGCPDRTIEPVNCHMTCEGYIFRQKQNEEKKKKRAAEKDYNNFKKQSVQETKAKVKR